MTTESSPESGSKGVAPHDRRWLRFTPCLGHGRGDPRAKTVETEPTFTDDEVEYAMEAAGVPGTATHAAYAAMAADKAQGGNP